MVKTIKKIITTLLIICITFSCITVSHASSLAIGLGTITGDDVIMRAKPSSDSNVIIFLSKDTIVNVTEVLDSYYCINYDGSMGYVSKQYCDYVAAPCTFDLIGSASDGSVNVRSSRSTDGEALGSVSTSISTVALEDGWFTIYYGGKLAYVRSDFFYITDSGEIKAKSSSEKEDEDISKDNIEDNSINEGLPGLVTKSHVQLKSEASSTSKTLLQLSRNSIIAVLDDDSSSEWLYVSVDGQNGYIESSAVLLKQLNESKVEENNEVVATEKTVTPASTTSSTAVKGVGTVLSDTCVYEEASNNSTSLVSIKTGAVVAVLNTDNNWYLVRYDGKEGYMENSTLDVTADECDISTYGYIKADELNVRQSASTNAKKVFTVRNGACVDVIGFNNGWFKISYSSNIGYVSGDYVMLTDTKLQAIPKEATEEKKEETTTIATIGTGTGADIVAYAQQFIGTRYVYGGASPSGFDCSGFTMYVYSQYDIALPHGATSQLNYGTEVSKGNLSAGDLVFFQDYNLASSTASHVGIYIGNNQFIHASSSTGYCVKVSSLDETYYSNHYLTARRLV